MKQILDEINAIKNSEIEKVIQTRTQEFLKILDEGENSWFSELCFCLLTANSTAQRGIDIQKELGYKGFSTMPYEKLEEKFKKAGHRFYNIRASSIIKARKYDGILKKTLEKLNREEKRKWLVDNIHGIGMKEASHFLRNTGHLDYAILDRHILNYLKDNKLFEYNTLTPKKYIEAENILEKISKKSGIKQGTLDLYLWYKQTGKVLK